jgi:lycopene cyclase domain-containing protein
MDERATYLAFLIPWATPVLAIQWLAGSRELRERWKAVLSSTIIATVYLASADCFALGNGIWQISPIRSTGLTLVGLPLEELLFFFFTNLMVAQSVTLLMAPSLTTKIVRHRLAARWQSLRRLGGLD